MTKTLKRLLGVCTGLLLMFTIPVEHVVAALKYHLLPLQDQETFSP